jgi:NACalpha-BTF3-like transcription factor
MEVIGTMRYLPRAEALADTEDLAHELAEAAGRCHATGLDPDVYRSLIVATVMLGERPKRGPAWANDAEMVETIEDLTDQARIRVEEIRLLAAEVEAARETVRVELSAAKRDVAAAGSGQERAHARARADRARTAVADCDTAMEVLADADARLVAVVPRLLAVPDELGDTYAAAYETLGRGHRLPFDGRFLGATV